LQIRETLVLQIQQLASEPAIKGQIRGCQLCDHQAALRAYETYRVMLSEAMQVTPSAETEALVARIQADEALAFRLPGHASPPPSPTLSITRPIRASGDIESPLVGRANEYLTMVETYTMLYNADRRRS